MDTPIGPIHSSDSVVRIEGHGGGERRSPAHHHVVHGEVVAVHQRAGHHEEGHILDTTVGAEPYDELVIRVTAGEVSELTGKHVRVIVET